MVCLSGELSVLTLGSQVPTSVYPASQGVTVNVMVAVSSTTQGNQNWAEIVEVTAYSYRKKNIVYDKCT